MACYRYISFEVICHAECFNGLYVTLPCFSVHVELQDTPFSSGTPVLHIWRCNNRGHITNGCRLLWGKIIYKCSMLLGNECTHPLLFNRLKLTKNSLLKKVAFPLVLERIHTLKEQSLTRMLVLETTWRLYLYTYFC